MSPEMSIERGTGNLLVAEVDALVNTVNTVGVMGKGLALQFKKAFPEAFHDYAAACKRNEVVIGRMYVTRRLTAPRFIINFPTKRHWRGRSKVEYIRAGLADLVTQIESLGIESIAIPPLGCGHGGLDWRVVKPLIVDALAPLKNLRVLLFEPGGTPRPDAIVDRRPRLQMTPSRALLIALMGKYIETGYDYRLSLVELQKLAYFLQVAGEPLRLRYRAHYYGPYADNLRKALRNMEGHFTRGVGDGANNPETPLELLPDALEHALAFIEEREDSRQRLEQVAELIEGFETPLGMELLATVHWSMTQTDIDANDLERVIEAVQSWSPRKRSLMSPAQIRAAWRLLHERGWVPSPDNSTRTVN